MTFKVVYGSWKKYPLKERAKVSISAINFLGDFPKGPSTHNRLQSKTSGPPWKSKVFSSELHGSSPPPPPPQQRHTRCAPSHSGWKQSVTFLGLRYVRACSKAEGNGILQAQRMHPDRLIRKVFLNQKVWEELSSLEAFRDLWQMGFSARPPRI